MKYPAVMLVGKAGSGKDTTANIVAKMTNANVVALADPLKHIVQALYGFDDEQLWGESKLRSTPKEFLAKDLQSIFNYQTIAFKMPLGFRCTEGHDSALQALIDYGISEYAPLAPNQNISLYPRKVLQDIGEWVRGNNDKYWIDINLKMVDGLLETGFRYERTNDSSIPDGKARTLVVVPDGRYKNEVLSAKKAGFLLVKVINPEESSKDVHSSETEIDQMPDFWFDVIISNDKERGLKGLERAVKRIVETYITDSAHKDSSDYVWGR